MSSDSTDAPSADTVRVLVENHARFLAFLRSRVGSREAAEEILQAAFVKGIEKQDTLRDGESAVSWFYRLLRNATVDHYRRKGAERRGSERYANEVTGETAELDVQTHGEICACVNALIPTLKTEYADVLRRVEIEGHPITAAATELGITANNAGVRLHRAREALKKRLEQTCGTCTEHGCLECTCQTSRG